MARPSSLQVARALTQSPRSLQTSPANAYGFGQYSPLVQQYDEWSYGRPNTMLPRPAPAFLTGAFGPLTPIQPVAVDVPPEGEKRPGPRRWQYPVGWNMPVGTPGTEGLKLVNFAISRAFADLYNVARAAIDLRIDEICQMDWEIVPTKDAEKAMRGDRAAHEDWKERAAIATKWWKRPDSDYISLHDWQRDLLEDHFVIDAMTLWMAPTMEKGKGPFGSDLAELWRVDGSLMRPLADLAGSIPRPPAVGYQQYLWGVPRSDFMKPITDDLDDVMRAAVGVGQDVASALEAGDIEPGRAYRADEIIYAPYYRRRWTPYGFAPTEKAIMSIAIGLKRQEYVLEYYTEGTMPGMFITPGMETDPMQTQMLQNFLDGISGDQAWKHKGFILPPGTKAEPIKPWSLTDQTDEIAMNWVCMSYGVSPMELGILPKVSSTVSPGASNQMAKMTASQSQRKGVKPLMQFLKRSIFDYVLHEIWHQEDMEWHWAGLDPPEDLETKVNTHLAIMSKGAESVDEFRVEVLGKEPWGLPMTSDPLYFATTGPIPMGSIDASTGKPIAEAQPTAPEAAPPPDGATPPETPPSDGAPAHATPTAAPQSPAHAGAEASEEAAGPAPAAQKASLADQLDEVETLGRYLRKGGRRRPFVGRALSPAQIAEITESRDLQKARANLRREHRERRLTPIQAETTGALAALVAKLRVGKVATPTFVDAVRSTMASGTSAAYTAGALDAAPDYATSAEGLAAVATRTKLQTLRGYAENLLQDVLGGISAAAIANRLQQWGASLQPAYEQGYGDQQPPDSLATWRTDGGEICDLCQARNGQVYTPESLPGWPGDGGYGDLCEGGPRCKCVLDWTTGRGTNTLRPYALTEDAERQRRAAEIADQQEQEREQFLSELPAGSQARARERDQVRAEIALRTHRDQDEVSAAEVRAELEATGRWPQR